MPKCVFCESMTGPFTRNEHLVPESLGGEIILPSGLVCDKCNEYFGRNVEQPALNAPIISFLRTSLGIPNKKGKQRYHKGVQFEIFGRNPDLSLMVFPFEKLTHILRTGGGQLRIPAESGLSSICRLLLKMGIECLALSYDYDVFDAQFVRAREAARSPRKGMSWPIAYGRLKISDSSNGVSTNLEGLFQEELVYKIELALEDEPLMVGFHFVYSWSQFLVPLNDAIDFGAFQKIIAKHNVLHSHEPPFRAVLPDISKLDTV